MTQEDWNLYNDLDCSTGEHALARVGFHDILVEYVNYIAAGERHPHGLVIWVREGTGCF